MMMPKWVKRLWIGDDTWIRVTAVLGWFVLMLMAIRETFEGSEYGSLYITATAFVFILTAINLGEHITGGNGK